MTAIEFWKEFSNLFSEDEKTNELLKDLWYCSKDYTATILDKISVFLQKYSIITEKEYYRIDLIGWKQLKENKYRLSEVSKLKDTQFENYLWDLEVAVEHENSSISWMDEVVKLLHINCPLRVVIGYLPIEQKDNHSDYLDAITTQILKTNVVTNQSALKNGEFMIIIGDSKCGQDKELYCKYKGYVFNPLIEKFVNVETLNP